MSQYNILPDPQLPNDEEIRASMNFETVYERAVSPARPSLRWWQRLRLRPRLFAGIALVFAVAVLVYDAVQEEEQASALYRTARMALDSVPDYAGTSSGYKSVIRNDTNFVQISVAEGKTETFTLSHISPADSFSYKVLYYNQSRKIWEEKAALSPTIKRRAVFRLDVLPHEFPELDSIRDLYWEQLQGPPMDSLRQIRWDNVAVERRYNGQYAISFSQGQHREVVGARPISGFRQGERRCYYTLKTNQSGIYMLIMDKSSQNP